MYMPKEWTLKFEFEGGKVTTVVVARTEAGARGFVPSGAVNVRVRVKRKR